VFRSRCFHALILLVLSTSAAAQLSLSIVDGPDPVISGAKIAYQVDFSNNTSTDVSNATLNLALDPNLFLASFNAPPGWTCSSTTCTTPSFAAHTGFFIYIVATVRPNTRGGTVLMTSATLGDQTVTATTNVLSPALIRSAKTMLPGPYLETQTVNYLIVLSDLGEASQGDNPGDEMTDVLPSSLALVGATANFGTVTANLAPNTVTWNGSVSKSAVIAINVFATIKSGAGGTPTSNQASFSYDADGDGINDTSGTSNILTFTPLAASTLPALSIYGLFALFVSLALLATYKMCG